MRTITTMLLVALLAVPAFVSAGEPQYKAVDNWLKTPDGLESIGPAHGDIAVSSNGDVYVSILMGSKAGLQVFNSKGEYLRNVPNAPPDLHGFVIRNDADGEFIYAARLAGRSILKMRLDGEIALEIAGSTIPEEYWLTREGKPVLALTAVDVAPDGRIFAVDGYASDFIHVFDHQGKYLNSFGGKQSPYEFKTNHKIAIDTRFDPPRIICCDRENRRMVNLSLDGEVLSVIPNMKRPAAVAIFGDLAAVGEIEGRVSLLDKDGNTVRTIGENLIEEETATYKVKPSDWRSGILTAPHGLDFDDQGNLYVTEFNQYGRVVKYEREPSAEGE